jgi:deoxyribonuclease IV
MSITGGLHNAFARGTSVGCTTMQIFTKNNNRWAGPPYTPEDVQRFRDAGIDAGIAPVVAHAAYLINLCAAAPGTLAQSRTAYTDELRRCDAFGLLGLVVHPGAHVGQGEDEGIRLIAESLNEAHAATPEVRTLSILETTAGQGTSLGYRFEQLRAIIDGVRNPSRMAVCLDTCHVFAAGYDIATEKGWEATFDEFDHIIGLSRLAAIHVNDSKKGLGSKVDRHDHIGQGVIGVTAFRMLMNDSRLAAIPKILETDKSEDLHEDVENMRILRSLIAPA